MNELVVRMKNTSELSDIEVSNLIALKQQYWNYSDDEQKEWLITNIRQDDNHLLIYRGGVLIAYLNAVNVEVNINQSMHRMLGIGNVCVDKNETHTGVGGILITCINSFIKKSNTPGILLCREKLIPFYKAYNWSEVRPETVIINDSLFDHIIMVFDPEKQVSSFSGTISLDRSF